MTPARRSPLQRLLDLIEVAGNRLPDPAVLFALCLGATLLLSKLLAGVDFGLVDPRTVSAANPDGSPLRVLDQLAPPALAAFLAGSVRAFTDFPPLGIVLVALLGVGIAEAAGFVDACLKALMGVTPRRLLAPVVVLAGLLSHTAADSGYVLVVPMGAVLFSAAGRHPLAGIAAAFAGVGGGFAANPLPCGIDPMLAGITAAGAALLDPAHAVNPLCNYFFTATSSALIVALGWWLTDRVVEPRLAGLAVDGDPADMPQLHPLEPRERRAMWMGLGAGALLALALLLWALPADSALRAPDGSLTRGSGAAGPGAPLIDSIVPLIFLLFAVPGLVHGYASGRFTGHRDVIRGMSRAMGTMAYYIVLVFFAALFIKAFNQSNLGPLLALEGAATLRAAGAGHGPTLAGLILVATTVNLVIGSCSAKWTLLAPIFVPMLMGLGLSPELTQAAYRVGGSCTNVITPMNPYFPLVVVFCQRYVKGAGVGTVAAMMLPYCLTFLVAWTGFLLAWWGLGLPLGVEAGFAWP